MSSGHRDWCRLGKLPFALLAIIMDEVDSVILLSLRQSGCKIPETIDDVSQLDTNLLVRSASQCLSVIGGVGEFPSFDNAALPDQKSLQFRVCSDIAKALQKLGFSGELGFHQFLYPNVKDTRKLFLWLVDRLPKAEGQGQGEADGTGLGLGGGLEALSSSALEQLRQGASRLWAPSNLQRRGTSRTGRISATTVPLFGLEGVSEESMKEPAAKNYWNKHLQPVPFQASAKEVIAASIFEENAKRLAIEANEEAREFDQSLEKEGKTGDAKRAQAVAQLFRDVLRTENAAVGNVNDREGNQAERKRTVKTAADLEALLDDLGIGEKKAETTTFEKQRDFTQEKVQMPETTFATEETEAKEAGEESTEEEVAAEKEEAKKAEVDDKAAEKSRKRELLLKKKKEAALQRKREAELQKLTEETDALAAEFADLQKRKELATATIRQYEDEAEVEEANMRKLMEEFKMKKKSMNLLEDAEKNLSELREVSSASAQKLVDLAAEWEKYRIPLLEDLRSARAEVEKRRQTTQKKIDDIRNMREQMKDLVSDIREKDERLKQLYDEYEKLPKNVHRGGYTRRIMDVVKQVEKQKVDIRKILKDTREMQRTYNNASDTLSRAYATIDEMIFYGLTALAVQEAKTGAKTAPAAKEAYKRLVDIHQSFQRLARSVEEQGSLSIEVRELELKIEQLQSRNTALNLDKIQADLSNIREENEQIEKKLRRKSRK